MNVIELLRQVKPGDSMSRESETRTYTYSGDKRMCEWLTRDALPRDVMADDWIIHGKSSTNAQGLVVAVDAEPVHLEATAIVAMLRQHFDIPERRDALVREMWLAMQLLATPESCADFIRRAVVIPA
ncbi:hypothetical protein H8I91_21520 [Serratia fonticola]|uniref:hypothetical protein n=1 Tax=Serratia fonticola TaxID=47917 RepID=UPI001646845C|nr:hypothetical protein [Serratia fonticola]MBC3252848.1 hypothetical protein [Serratia fonticola]